MPAKIVVDISRMTLAGMARSYNARYRRGDQPVALRGNVQKGDQPVPPTKERHVPKARPIQ